MEKSNTESSSATSMYCTTVVAEELPVVDVPSVLSVYSSALEAHPAVDESLASSQHWTTIESTSSEDRGNNFVRVLPGRKVRKFEMKDIKLLEQIGEGAQGSIHTAQICQSELDGEPDDEIYVAKVFKGRNHGQWPEDVFGLHVSSQYVCQFEGYCSDGDSFYLLMAKYDCSLRDVIDKLMKEKVSRTDDYPYNNNCNGPGPFSDPNVLRMIIEIALGMRFLHENNIIHRDLKADNIFVRIYRGRGNDTSYEAYIGDFDVASNVVGTQFWRAPEVLQAVKDGKRPVFTPKADVYSFAMTCYEILTGGIPFEGVRFTDFNVVLSGKRPKLPSHLNPKLKDLLSRCWHQCLDMRPSFVEIVAELKELHRELITGFEPMSRALDAMFDDSKSYLDIVAAGPEVSLVELKDLLPALVVKYNQADFLLLGSEIVADMEQFQTRFGLRPYKEQPVLPFPEWIAREMLHNNISWKVRVLRRIKAYITEMVKITRLLENVEQSMGEEVDYDTCDIQSENLRTQPEMVSTYESSFADFRAWEEEYLTRVLPDYRHRTCLERGPYGSKACDLCRRESPAFVHREKGNMEYHLYVDHGSTFSKLTMSIVSSVKAKMGAVF